MTTHCVTRVMPSSSGFTIMYIKIQVDTALNMFEYLYRREQRFQVSAPFRFLNAAFLSARWENKF